MNALFELLISHQEDAAIFAEQFFLIFLRVGTAMAVLPAFGEQSVPARVRLGVALALTLAVVPLAPMGALTAGSFGTETLIGLFLGLSLRFFVFALSTAGTIAANATSLSQVFPQAGEPQPAMSTLLVMAGLALAMQADLPVRMVRFFAFSYDTFPMAQWPDVADVVAWVTRHADESFSLAFALSMPFVIASLLYNVALGAINRAMPALMVTFVGAPALSLGGLALLAIVAPLVLQAWIAAFAQFVAHPFHGP